MPIHIVATLPKDLGKRIFFGPGQSFVFMHDTPCEHDECAALATNVIKGETDSFGWEPILLCQTCTQKLIDDEKTYDNALDVEDRAPAEGCVFMVSETTNCDSGDQWFRLMRSYRAAKAFYRRIEDAAASKGGLYPNAGVREVPIEKGEQAQAAHRKAMDKLFDSMLG